MIVKRDSSLTSHWFHIRKHHNIWCLL